MSVTPNGARKAARAESPEVRSPADGRLVAELPVDGGTELARKAAALRAGQRADPLPVAHAGGERTRAAEQFDVRVPTFRTHLVVRW